MTDIKSLSADYFEEKAEEYTKDYYLSQSNHPKWQRQEAIVQMIKDNIVSSSSKILNLGCGPGLLEEELAKSGFGGVGIDSSEHMIRICQSRSDKYSFSDNWAFKVGDCEKTDFANESFDCVVASGLIEYMPEDKKMLSESYRVLKPNGILILNVGNVFGWSTLLNEFSYYLKNIPGVLSFANFIKQNLLKESTQAKQLPFIPRKTIPFIFRKRALRKGFSLVSDRYQGFTLLPAPLETVFKSIILRGKEIDLEGLGKTPLKYIGASYLICLKKQI